MAPRRFVTSLVGREYSRIEVNKSKRWCSTRPGHHPVVHRRNSVPANNGRGIVASVYRDTGCGLLSARIRNVSPRQKKKKKKKRRRDELREPTSRATSCALNNGHRYVLVFKLCDRPLLVYPHFYS